jgi:uncharacterized protein HemX
MDAAYEPPPDPHAAKHRRPWGWIVVVALLVAIAAGLAIWAISLQGDLDDQKAATAEAQQQAETANNQVDEVTAQLDELSQSVSDATDQLQQSGSDIRQDAEDAFADLESRVADLKDRIAAAAEGAQEQPSEDSP